MRILLIALVLAAVVPYASAEVIDYEKKDITVKIVYYGPGPVEANLRYIHDKTNADAKGDMVDLVSAEQRKKGEYFSYLPLSLGEIRGFKVHVHLYTTPSGAKLAATRKKILKDADGIIFVADADPKHAKDNLRLYGELKKATKKPLPVVFQITGAGDAAPVEKALAVGDRPVFTAKPASGEGVFETLKSVTKLVLLELKNAGAAP